MSLGVPQVRRQNKCPEKVLLSPESEDNDLARKKTHRTVRASVSRRLMKRTIVTLATPVRALHLHPQIRKSVAWMPTTHQKVHQALPTASVASVWIRFPCQFSKTAMGQMGRSYNKSTIRR
jgi:hypothetical protein